MPEEIRVEITTNAAQVLARLRKFPADMAEEIAGALDEQNELTVGYVQENKLSQRGPDTLGVVTNRLRSSSRPKKATVRSDFSLIDSSLGSNVRYAGAHEFGFDGNVTVRSFQRRNRSGDIYQVSQKNPAVLGADGKITKAKKTTTQKTGDLRGTKGARLLAAGITTVRSHSRKMHIKARAPFRTGLRERVPQYTEAISQAIVTAWESGTS